MPNMYQLRTMWKDALTRKGLQISDLDSATQALITDYNSKETAYTTKATNWENARNTAETLQRELIGDRSDIMQIDGKINQAIMLMRRDDPASPAPAPSAPAPSNP